MYNFWNYWYFVLVSFRSVVLICSYNKNGIIFLFYHSVVLSIRTCPPPPTFIVVYWCMCRYVYTCTWKPEYNLRTGFLRCYSLFLFIYSFIYLFEIGCVTGLGFTLYVYHVWYMWNGWIELINMCMTSYNFSCIENALKISVFQWSGI